MVGLVLVIQHLQQVVVVAEQRPLETHLHQQLAVMAVMEQHLLYLEVLLHTLVVVVGAAMADFPPGRLE